MAHVVHRSSRLLAGLAGVLVLFACGSALAQIFVYPQRPSQTPVRYEEFDWRWVDIRRAEDAPEEPTWETGPRLHHLGLRAAAGPGGWMLGRPSTRSASHARAAGHLPPRPTNPNMRGDTERPRLARGAIAAAAANSTPPEPPEPELRGGGVRLYFYEDAHPVAERAAGQIANAYDFLALEFDFVTPRTFPYFLYETYHDFLQTNLFPVQEGVLGVTATRGELEMVLPYFGDHQLFAHISTHELAHQFTIQKVRYRAAEAGVAADPLMRFPLWFIEGIAEYYALGGLDPETGMLVSDLVLNPDPDENYELPNFFAQLPLGFLWTYKLGQARVAFLEEAYGPGTTQRILDESPRLVARLDGQRRALAFPELVEFVTGDSPDEIHTRFEAWMSELAARRASAAPQPSDALETLDLGNASVQVISSTADGSIILFRRILPEVGRTELRLADVTRPGQSVRVAADGVPGIESLHPIGGRNIAVGASSLAFAARSGGRDVIYWQAYEHDVERGEISLGDRRSYSFDDPEIAQVDALALSPRGDQLAFIGLERGGTMDLYVVDRESGEARPLTDEPYTARGLSWGEGGIVYTSDATEEGYFNLFRVRQPGARPERVLVERRDHLDPQVLPGGRTMFVAYDDAGANVYEVDVERGASVRRSGVPTGVFSPVPAPDGVWVLHHEAGERQIARLANTEMLDEAGPAPARAGPAEPIERLEIEEVAAYEPFSLDNWSVGPIFGLFGASTQGVFGQGIAVASDRLRDHALILQIQAFGEWDLIDGDLFYTNARRRTLWGGGIFQEVAFRLDTTFDEEPDGFLFTSAERFAGARTVLRYPFDRFRFVQVGLASGVVSRFLIDPWDEILASPEANPLGRDLVPEWDDEFGGLAFRTEATLSFGYNTLRFHPLAGPISGSSALISGTGTTEPGGIGNYARTRLDGEYYIPVRGAAHVMTRAGFGQIFGSEDARSYFVSSLEALRSVPFGDEDILLGRSYGFSTAELRVPLARFGILDLEGIAGADFGGIGDDPQGIWDNRILNAVTGLNFGLGLIVLRLHFAYPFDVGGILPNDGDLNVNFSLAFRQLR
jgi:hypothetical protein